MVGSEDRIMEQAVYLAHHYLPIRKTLGAYQLNQVTLGEGHKEAIAFLHQITCQLCLVLLQLLNFLLYRVPTDEANRNHLFVLPNAVAAVNRLVFDCRRAYMGVFSNCSLLVDSIRSRSSFSRAS